MLVVAQNCGLAARRGDCLRWALDAANGTFRFDDVSCQGRTVREIGISRISKMHHNNASQVSHERPFSVICGFPGVMERATVSPASQLRFVASAYRIVITLDLSPHVRAVVGAAAAPRRCRINLT